MGGKHKANRTKNNARPSSSGRSAELLRSSIPQFIGYSGIKETGFGFSLGTTDELDASIDPNVQLILKKITKKDSTTKLKGLQEFVDLVKNSEEDFTKSILPIWPRFYNVLATDVDNRVREATHNVHQQIVLKAKRNLAPYLKQLMAPWFTSQYDTYPPAASAAFQAFKDAFPTNKTQEAIVFCQDEILTYIHDNLLVQTAQTLSNTKNLSAEENEAKYERILISCLQGYCLYLEKVSTDHIQNASTLNNNIISNGKYWKLAKHKVPHIRAAWFKVLTNICQKAPFLLDGKGAQVTGTVFANLEENDVIVLPCVWEAALLTVSTVKEWWTFINIDKLFFPKLWKILKQGGQGNATIIYPSLLPLISHMPLTVEENPSQFYNTFFENLRFGLKQKSVVASRSESVAVAIAFIECLQYIIMNKHNDVHLCKSLIKNHLLSTIEWCLVDDQASYKAIFNQTASLLQNWSRNTQLKTLDSYLQFFFDHVSDLFRETLFNLKELENYDLSGISCKQLEFLQSLKHISKPKKQLKVTFSGEPSEILKPTTSHLESSLTADNSYFQKLNLLAYSICEFYVEYIRDKKSKEILEHLCSLLVDFDSENFFLTLNANMKKNPHSKLINIYNELLADWLESKELCSKEIVSLIFLLFKYVENEDKQMILDKLSEVSADGFLGWCISEALAHPHNKDPIIKNWLQNEKVSKFLVSIVDKEIRDESTPELSVLLKLVLTENEDGELFIHKEAMSEIIHKLNVTMENYAEYPVTVDTCASLAAYISAVIYTENLLLSYGDSLLVSLFTLACNPDIDNDKISTETIYEINTAWQDAVTLLSKHVNKNENQTLTSKLADIVEATFLKSDCLAHLTNIIVCYLRAMYKSVPLSLTDYVLVFLDRPFLLPWKADMYKLCAGAEYVKGNLSSPYKEILPPSENIREVYIAKFSAWNYLKLAVVATNLEEEFEEDDDDIKKNPASIFNVIDDSEEFIAHILHDFCVSQSYVDNFKNTKHYDSVLNYYALTESKIKSTFENSDNDFKSRIKSILKDKSITEAWFWCRAAYMLYSSIIPESLVKIYAEFTENAADNNLGVLHLTQVFSKHINYDYIDTKYNLAGDYIIFNSLICSEDMHVQIEEVLPNIEKFSDLNVMDLWYNSNFSWESTQEIIEGVRLFSGLMKGQDSLIRNRHWGSAMSSLFFSTTKCHKFREMHENYQFQALLGAVAHLYVTTENQVKEELINTFEKIMHDVHIEIIDLDLLQLWMYLADQLEQKSNILPYLPLIQTFGSVINSINHKFVFKVNIPSQPKWTKFLKKSCSLLVNPQPHLQIWGYKMLLILVPGLIQIDTEAVNTNNPHKMGLIFEQFKDKLVETHEIVNSMLMGFKLGDDSCRVEPSTDSFTYTFAYLLLWDILLTLCDSAATELRFQYADWLRNEDLLKNFLNNLFRLMPTEVLHFSEGKSKSLLEYFFRKPDIDLEGTCDSEKIEKLVCWLYSSTLTQLPALVRQWWTGLETKIAQVVEKVTAIYVSPHLCAQELNDLMTYQNNFKNMVLKVMPGAREVIATYTVDEAQVELVITLPANYPLGGVEVQCNRQIGGTSHKQWLLQFKKCVLHQNGRIWDGLSLWNNNLDKKFDGVEECYICYTVLHPGTYQLPKLSCQTCKKKFHSACLYKWFRTSYKSSCPICRNLF